MRKLKTTIVVTGVLMLLFFYRNLSGICYDSGESSSLQTNTKSAQTKTKTTQTNTKSTQTKTKPKQATSKTTQPAKKSEPEVKKKIPGTVIIGTQTWAEANLIVTTFRNGDTIPEAKSNKEWIAAGEAGKPAWCYYNNDPKFGQRYGKLYNWYAVNDPRGLAPVGWILSSDADWIKLGNFLGGEAAGTKMKSTNGWNEGENGTNESGFTALPGGYRIENGAFVNVGTTAIWWSTTENKSISAIDHYIVFGARLSSSSSPKQRGESVRCLRE